MHLLLCFVGWVVAGFLNCSVCFACICGWWVHAFVLRCTFLIVHSCC